MTLDNLNNVCFPLTFIKPSTVLTISKHFITKFGSTKTKLKAFNKLLILLVISCLYLDVETSVQHIWFCSSVVFLQIASFSFNCRCESCHGQAERLLDSAKEMEDSIAFNLRSVLVCIFVFWLLVWAIAKRYANYLYMFVAFSHNFSKSIK